MPVDEAYKAAKASIEGGQLIPLPAMALTAFAKALDFELKGDTEASDKWLATALRAEAKALTA